MKVLKKGKKKITKTYYTVTCANCGCVFMFEESEAESIEREKKLNGAFNGIVKCPCCENTVLFTEKADSTTEEEEIELNPIIKTNFQTWDKLVHTYDKLSGLRLGGTGTEALHNNSYCADCPNKNKAFLDQVGDSPCQWCEHSPFRLTCSANGDSTC